MESRRERFIRLAEKRVNRSIKELELVGNLGNRAAYDYSDADVKKIFRALDGALKESRSKFGEGDRSENSRFSLRGQTD